MCGVCLWVLALCGREGQFLNCPHDIIPEYLDTTVASVSSASVKMDVAKDLTRRGSEVHFRWWPTKAFLCVKWPI
jgi:hypothetical protein